jgi:hypothetical protein
MTLTDEVPLSVLTMVIGAVLEAIVAPLGDVAYSRLAKGRRQGLESAFLCSLQQMASGSSRKSLLSFLVRRIPAQ